MPAIVLPALLGVLAQGCGNGSGGGTATDTIADTTSHAWPDTLRVVTLYSPTSYFIYKEEEMGYDYDLVNRLAHDKDLAIDLQVAPSLGRAIEMLDSGYADLIAYEIPVTAEYKPYVAPCGVERITTQVLVQPRDSKDGPIRDVTQLVGKDVYVEGNSKYYHRLVNLNDELGGGINIHSIDRDTLITEDLIEMVHNGKIPLTVVDSDIAELNNTYYTDLDITLQISYPQRAQWGVSPTRQWLADSITAWTLQEAPQRANAELLKRYFELAKRSSYANEGPASYIFSNGRVSPYDELFKRYAEGIGWDWRLLSAQGYVESHFDNSVVSWAGARGIMQIMPSTARAHGLSAEMMTDNDASIRTAAKIVGGLEKALASKVPDPAERKKFIVAAYNSGLGHIYDAIALAGKYGLDPEVWDGNVEQAVLMKTKPEYYNDPVCRHGYFRGRQTVDYVRQVYDFYARSCHEVKK